MGLVASPSSLPGPHTSPLRPRCTRFGGRGAACRGPARGGTGRLIKAGYDIWPAVERLSRTAGRSPQGRPAAE